MSASLTVALAILTRLTLEPVINMAEEVHNPSKILPKAIVSSVPIGTLSGVIFLLPILLTLPDVATLLQG